MPKILISDKLAQEGIDILKKVADVDIKTGLPEDELCKIIGEYDALVIRSGTQVTATVLEAAKKLRIIGRAGVGVDNVDVPIATEKGVIVVNSPGGNTLAAAELTVGLLLSLTRNIPQAYLSMKAKEWARSKFTGNEVYTKTLGVLGLGKIGQEVVKRCQAFGMKVLAYDPFINQAAADALGVEMVSFDDCLKRADFISLHLPKNKDTLGMISDKQFAMMKDGVRIVNCARGGIIDDAALIAALKSGKVAGAAIDVYIKEPPDFASEIFDLPNVVTTPHLGASTEEAQTNVAIDVAEQIVDYFEGRPCRSAVNMPALPAEVLAAVQPYLPLAESIGSLAAQLAEGRVTGMEIKFAGEVAGIETGPITRAVITGFLRPSIGADSVNYVNAFVMAKSRGIEVAETKAADGGDYASMITLSVSTDAGQKTISGTTFGTKEPRIVSMDGQPMEFVPKGIILVSPHVDRPGTIGKVGTILGDEGINIAGMHVGRQVPNAKAIMVLNVDTEASQKVLDKILKVPGVEGLKQVFL